MKEFLKSYKPEDRHFTSCEEMYLITKKLGLSSKSFEELQEVRNKVVRFYSDIMTEEIEKYGRLTDREMDMMSAMQSVTAVIDNLMYRFHRAI